MHNRLVIRCFAVMLMVACASLAVTGCVTTAMRSHTPSPPEHFVDYKPDWLLALGPDQQTNGTVLRYGQENDQPFTLSGFKIVNQGGKEDAITVSFFADGRIVYHGGEGKITKVSTGETVLVPFDRPGTRSEGETGGEKKRGSGGANWVKFLSS